MAHNGGMTSLKPQRRHPLSGTTTPAIEAALRLHIIAGLPMRKAVEQAGCTLSGLRYAKRLHAARIRATQQQASAAQ